MSRKIETIYESHKKKWCTTIKTKNKHGEEWVVHDIHDEEKPSEELLQILHTELSRGVEESNKKEFVHTKYHDMV